MQPFRTSLGQEKAKIVQFSDDNRVLPDGSKVVYAENDNKIVLFYKKPFEKGTTYIFERDSGKIWVNNQPGTNEDKRKMIQLGTYFLSNASEDDLVTINVHTKDQ